LVGSANERYSSRKLNCKRTTFMRQILRILRIRRESNFCHDIENFFVLVGTDKVQVIRFVLVPCVDADNCPTRQCRTYSILHKMPVDDSSKVLKRYVFRYPIFHTRPSGACRTFEAFFEGEKSFCIFPWAC